MCKIKKKFIRIKTNKTIKNKIHNLTENHQQTNK